MFFSLLYFILLFCVSIIIKHEIFEVEQWDKKLFSLITDFVKKMGFRCIIDIDLFEIDGNWYISEVNPRFGGGYPHAWACGVRVPEMIVRNLEGQTNVPEIGNYPVGKIMMKYNEIMVR